MDIMDITDVTSFGVILLPVVVLAIIAFVYYRRIQNDTMQRNGSKAGHHKEATSQGAKNDGGDFSLSHSQKQTSQNAAKTTKGQNRNGGGGSSSNNKRHDKNAFTHPWLASTLKGHTDEIRSMDFSSNGKFLASCGEDRAILIWFSSQFEDAKNRKCFRFNTEYDFGTLLSWSPDGKAIAISRSFESSIEIYKLDKKDGWFVGSSKGATFPKVTDCDIVGFGISCTGRFLMSATNKTDLYIWDLKGNVLEKLDTCLMNNYSAKMSPCGRFVAVCGFSPDCKVYEVKFSRTGEYQKTIRAFDLSGHSSGIYDVAFDQDSSHVVTVSKDGTWRLYNTNVEYEKGQSPRLLKVGKWTPRSSPALIALSPNAEVLAISTGTSVEMISMISGECDAVVKHICEGGINRLIFDPLGKFLLTAGDRQIRIFHNITGYKTGIEVTKAKLKTGTMTVATRERLQNQIKESEEFLKKFE